jgi:hypothetical protein
MGPFLSMPSTSDIEAHMFSVQNAKDDGFIPKMVDHRVSEMVVPGRNSAACHTKAPKPKTNDGELNT